MAKQQEISDIFTPEGLAKLKVGQILTFNYEGSRNEYRITSLKDGKCWVKPTQTYTPDQVKITDINGKEVSIDSL